MRSFVSELRRRNVFRAAAFYAASAWLIVQIATQIFPFFDVPAWTVRWIVIAAVLGFPFLVAFAWLYELTPQGLKRESEVDRADSIAQRTGKKLDRWIIAVMAVAIVLLLANQLMMRKGASSDALVAIPQKSIAVLPTPSSSSPALAFRSSPTRRTTRPRRSSSSAARSARSTWVFRRKRRPCSPPASSEIGRRARARST